MPEPPSFVRSLLFRGGLVLLAACEAASGSSPSEGAQGLRTVDGEAGHIGYPRAEDGGDGVVADGDASAAVLETERCAWGVDSLLAKIEVQAPHRENCGFENALADLAEELACFWTAVDAGKAAELTLNEATDSYDLTTFVATAAGELLAVGMKPYGVPGGPSFGDAGMASVERCRAIEELQGRWTA